MSRFAPLPNQQKGTATELINWGDPGDYRNRGAMVPSQEAKYAQRDPAFRPLVPASSAKATASTSTPAAPVAKAKAPAKSADKIAAEAYAERAAKVMNSPAAAGKSKAAAKLLGTTKCSADQIISFLATDVQPDAVRQQAEIDTTWAKAVASVNARAGYADGHKTTENATQSGWAKAVAKVNAMNGFSA